MLTSLYIILLFFLVPLVIFLSIFIPIKVVRSKYRNFVLTHSLAIRKLEEINKKDDFKVVHEFNLKYSYDNENFYDNISCKDYLTYQLVYIGDKVRTALRDAKSNRENFVKYYQEIKDTCVLNKYDTEELLRNKSRLERFDKKVFEEKIYSPTIELNIKVFLRLTNINGDRKASKRETFDEDEIKDILKRLSQKNGSFYLNNDIWDSLCRVERGKVSNRLRFAIYQRDRYRCRNCGRKTDDLEIDHIIPIAKGGKSIPNNLRVLCSKCNGKKGAK